MLPIFFATHAVVNALVIAALRVRSPTYHAIPWIFAGAFLVSAIPGSAAGWRMAPCSGD